MSFWRSLQRLWTTDDGFVITTEKILVLTLAICALVVGVLSLQTALQNYFLDEVDAIAACTNQIVFGNQAQVMTTTDFDTLFPNLATQVTRPVPAPAKREAQ